MPDHHRQRCQFASPQDTLDCHGANTANRNLHVIGVSGDGDSLSIDPALLAISLGSSFVAPSFSGDKEQPIPLIKAELLHKGFAFLDGISACVTFNDHENSTRVAADGVARFLGDDA